MQIITEIRLKMKHDFQINLGGSTATDKIRPFLSKIQVSDRDGTELDTATVTLSYSDRIAIPTKGTSIEIFLGYRGEALYSVFKGIVNRIGVNGSPDQLFLKATGLALSDDKQLQSSTTRVWNEKTLGEIASEIIAGAGFKARVHQRLSNIEIKRYLQSVETDLELLQKLADAYSGFLKSDGETVAVLPVRSRESANGKTLPTVAIRRNSVSQFGWSDVKRKFGGKILAFYQKAGDGETKFVSRGSGKPERKLRTMYSSESEALAAVNHEIENREAQEIFSVTLPGRDIAVGSALQVEGFPSPISGEYWVNRVDHDFGKGYRVSIESER